VSASCDKTAGPPPHHTVTAAIHQKAINQNRQTDRQTDSVLIPTADYQDDTYGRLPGRCQPSRAEKSAAQFSGCRHQGGVDLCVRRRWETAAAGRTGGGRDMVQRVGRLYHWQPTTMADTYKMPPAARNPRAPDGTSPGPKSAKRPASRRTDPNTNAISSSGCIIERSAPAAALLRSVAGGKCHLPPATSRYMLRFRSTITAWPMINISTRLDGSGIASAGPAAC